MSSIRNYLISQAKDKLNPLRFYVYAYLRSKDSPTSKAGIPYYIGKGTGKRAWATHGSKIQIPKLIENIVILETNLSEIGAYALERTYIRWYGKKTHGGLLINLSDGGDGVSGYIRSESSKVRSKEFGRKMSEIALNRKLTPEQQIVRDKWLKIKETRILKRKLRKLNSQIKEIRKPFIKERAKERQSIAKLGTKMSTEVKAKLSSIHKIVQKNRNRVCHIQTRKEYDINTFTRCILNQIN
jgi:hypothetical protein